MKRMAFKMQLKKGFESEYKKRHDELWPELKELLKSTGISEYSIYLDETTHSLLGFLKIDNLELYEKLPLHSTMQKWWLFMKDVMESNLDNSPKSILLKEVFYLP